jgi:methyl coenzyme M reductase subunit C-like uncharacterized protein (methanogenesis marker protein 7)
MAGSRDNLVSRLADAGEQTIQRLVDAPGADRFLGGLTSMRERMDDMQKKLRGLDALEKRVATLERRLDKVEGKKTSSPRTVASTTAKKRSTAKSSSKKTTASPARSTGAAERKTGES